MGEERERYRTRVHELEEETKRLAAANRSLEDSIDERGGGGGRGGKVGGGGEQLQRAERERDSAIRVLRQHVVMEVVTDGDGKSWVA